MSRFARLRPLVLTYGMLVSASVAVGESFDPCASPAERMTPGSLWADRNVADAFTASARGDLARPQVDRDSAAAVRAQSPLDGPVQPASSAAYGHAPQFVCCPPPEPTWALFAPYGWVPAIDGTVTINGTTLPIDVSLSEMFDLLKRDLRGALLLHTELGRGDFGVILDGMVVSIAGSQVRGPLTANVQVDETVLELLGFYRVINQSHSEIPWTVDLLGGMRYYDFDFDGQFILGGVRTFDRGQSQNWVDLVIGIRSSVALTDSLDLFGRFDVGGFGIGTSSDPAINLQGGVQYEVAALEGLSLIAGYKYLKIDEDHSPGTPEAFGFHAAMFAPFVAFMFEF